MSGPAKPAPTYPEYEQLRVEADQRRGQFVNPATLHAVDRLDRPYDWFTAVLGRPYGGLRTLYGSDAELLLLAHQRDLNPPLPQWLVEQRAAAERTRVEAEARSRAARTAIAERDAAAWRTVADRVSVDLDVYANPTARPRGGHPHNLGHAVPRTDVYSGGRVVRVHPAGRALCESPTRATPLNLREDPEPDGTPVTCDRCMTWAPKVRPTR